MSSKVSLTLKFRLRVPGAPGDVRGPRREHASPLWRAVILVDTPPVNNGLPWQYPSELSVSVLLLCRSPKVQGALATWRGSFQVCIGILRFSVSCRERGTRGDVYRTKVKPFHWICLSSHSGHWENRLLLRLSHQWSRGLSECAVHVRVDCMKC